MAGYMRQRRLNRQKILRDFLFNQCRKCGEKEDLDFDHIDPNEKTFQLSGRSLDKPWILLLKEVGKCQLLCKKCHSEKTVIERGQVLARGTHGTISAYRYCKCVLCRKSAREISNIYYKTHKRITVNGKRIVIKIKNNSD